jgi:hypothetical protein
MPAEARVTCLSAALQRRARVGWCGATDGGEYLDVQSWNIYMHISCWCATVLFEQQPGKLTINLNRLSLTCICRKLSLKFSLAQYTLPLTLTSPKHFAPKQFVQSIRAEFRNSFSRKWFRTDRWDPSPYFKVQVITVSLQESLKSTQNGAP